MKRFRIAHYQKPPSIWFINGGSLYITDTHYIVKYFARTVATMEIAATTVSPLAANPINKGVRFECDNQNIDLYFFRKTANEVYAAVEL